MHPVAREGARLLLGAILMAGCISSEPSQLPPDERYGHRYENQGPGGRETIQLSAPDTSAEAYNYYPAVIDTLHIRPAPYEAAAEGGTPETRVEVLVKGSFPDGCSELHDAKQQRAGHIVTVTLQMRRPQGAVCTQVVRPYRFYMTLEGRYTPGDYLLKFNGYNYTFTLRPPA